MTPLRKTELKRFGEHAWEPSKRYPDSLRCTKCAWLFAGPIEIAPPDGCTALKRSRIEPKAKKKRDGVYGPYHEWVSTLPCHLEWTGDCLPPIKGHHIQSVGAGGKDASNEVPLCIRHHAMVHAKGDKTFERRWAVDLAQLARMYQRRFVMENIA